MMTDDAVPADEHMLENLLSPLWEGKAAMSYARQLPAPDCGVIERFTRDFNYPDQSVVKSAKDLPVLGIKTFFAPYSPEKSGLSAPSASPADPEAQTVFCPVCTPE